MRGIGSPFPTDRDRPFLPDEWLSEGGLLISGNGSTLRNVEEPRNAGCRDRVPPGRRLPRLLRPLKQSCPQGSLYPLQGPVSPHGVFVTAVSFVKVRARAQGMYDGRVAGGGVLILSESRSPVP